MLGFSFPCLSLPSDSSFTMLTATTAGVPFSVAFFDGETAVTRGDANNVDDAPIELAQIKGKVIAHIPHIGKLVRLLKTPVATFILIAGAVLTIELPYRKEKEKKDEELERIKAEIRRLKEEQES